MKGRKINPAPDLALLTSEDLSAEYENRNISLLMRELKYLTQFDGKPGIIMRAEQSWMMLTAEEQNEYSLRAYALPVSAFDLFIYDYLCLSGSEPEESMKILCQKPVKKH
ncbi:MAG TPA: hypothetical protein PK514_14125 [Spirochaetota bacterium]|nr:hypothetical protein [Spirochaetota bacterium]